MNKTVRRVFILIFFLLFAWTAFLVFGMQHILKVVNAKEYILGNAGLLGIGLGGFLLLCWVNRRYGERTEAFLQKHARALLLISLAVLLLWQIYSCYGGYFLTGWDAKRIRTTVGYQLRGKYAKLDQDYFSWFPNNRLLVWIFTSVARIATALGYENWQFSLTAFQCVLDVCAIWLVYRVTLDFAKSQRVAFLAYLTAYLFVGVSPWFIIAYSDATGFVLPIFMLRLFQRIRRAEKRWTRAAWSVLLGWVSMIGFYIKPQILIAFLAAALVEICCLPGRDFKRRLADFALRAVSCALGMGVFFASYHAVVVPALHFQSDPDQTIGWQHYVMMGLNVSCDGTWWAEDYDYTKSFPTNAERNAADLREAERRIRELGFGGMLQYLSRKQLVNYQDGTFAWTCEGRFFSSEAEWAQNAVSGFMRSLIRPEGENYQWFISSRQLIWVTVLFFLLFAFAFERRSVSAEGDCGMLMMALAVIGLTVFELLFEARARYLFCYAPYYVMLAAGGMRNADHLLGRLFRKRAGRPRDQSAFC